MRIGLVYHAMKATNERKFFMIKWIPSSLKFSVIILYMYYFV
jgi:hypothetical protein